MLFSIGLIGSNSPRPVLQFPPPPATPPPASSPFNIIPPPPSSSPLLLSTPTPLSSPHPSSYGGNPTPSPFLMNVWVCGGSSNYSAVDTLATADQRLLAMNYHQQYSTTTSNVSTSTPTSVDSPPSPPVAGYSRSAANASRLTSSCVLSTMSKWMHGKCTAAAAVGKSVSPPLHNTLAVVVRPDAHAFKQQASGGGKNVLSSGGGLAVSGGNSGQTTAAVNCCFSCIHANVILCFLLCSFHWLTLVYLAAGEYRIKAVR